MRRNFFTLAAAASAVLCAAVCVLWARSYWIEDELGGAYGWRYACVASFRGEIGCEFGRRNDGGPRNMYTDRPRVGYRRQLVRKFPDSDYIHIAEAGDRFGVMPHYHDIWGF